MEFIKNTVIGGGIVGLAIADSISKDEDTVLLEKSAFLLNETSSRNSEVIHSGIYYDQNSLKHKLCLEGKELLYSFCEKNDIPYKKLGKLIIL